MEKDQANPGSAALTTPDFVICGCVFLPHCPSAGSISR